jgi:hypothetical protein
VCGCCGVCCCACGTRRDPSSPVEKLLLPESNTVSGRESTVAAACTLSTRGPEDEEAGREDAVEAQLDEVVAVEEGVIEEEAVVDKDAEDNAEDDNGDVAEHEDADADVDDEGKQEAAAAAVVAAEEEAEEEPGVCLPCWR